MLVIDEHIAIGRTGDGHDYRGDHENEFVAFIEPCIPELLGAGLARGPIVRQAVKRYVVHWNIIWNTIFHHGLRR